VCGDKLQGRGRQVEEAPEPGPPRVTLGAPLGRAIGPLPAERTPTPRVVKTLFDGERDDVGEARK